MGIGDALAPLADGCSCAAVCQLSCVPPPPLSLTLLPPALLSLLPPRVNSSSSWLWPKPIRCAVGASMWQHRDRTLLQILDTHPTCRGVNVAAQGQHPDSKLDARPTVAL